jgi:anti-sigma factor RsiW
VVLTASGAGRGDRALGLEAVDDHLRLLMAQRPLEIESGGLHQVKPWFEGRLDFAPVVPDLSPLGLTLRGGAVGYFHDRRAAVLQYQLRAHLVTLLVFRADGLALPAAPRLAAPDRGFRAVLWRAGPLGYALVADVDPRELERVAAEAARVTSS